MKISLKKFLGIMPGIDPKKLPDNAAQTAQNVNLDGETLDVEYEATSIYALPDALRKNIYKYKYDYFALVCGTSGTLVALQSITSGSFSITINGTAYPITGCNFSGNTKAEMAAEMQVKIRTATSGHETVEYDTANDCFIFGSTVGIVTYLTGTLSTSTYLNGASGGTAVSTTRTSSAEWLSWTEENINVVKSPIIQDTFRRIYYSGYTGGKLRMKGLFGTRDVGVAVPSALPTGAVTAIAASGFSMNFVTNNPEYTVSCGTPTSATRTATGWRLIYRFPGYTHTGMSAITYHWSFNFYGLTDKRTTDIGTKFSLTYGGKVWATPELTVFTGSSAATGSGSAPSITGTWAACDVTVELDMHYVNTSTVECYYAYRYVSDLSEQGGGSPVSAKITRNGDEKTTVTVTGNSDTTTIKKIRIYRTATGSTPASDNMYYLTEINNPGATTTTYEDTTADTDLTEAYTPRTAPPDHLKYLVSHPGGFLAGAIGNLVYVCDQGLPHSWTIAPYPAEHEIMGMAVSGNDIVIVTKGYPYLLSGTSPASLRMSKLMINQSCASSRGIVNVGSTVCYPSPDGIVMIEGGQATIITDKFMQRSNWQAYTPSSMIGGTLNGKLYGFMTGGNLVFSFGDGLKSITTINDTASGLFCDLEDDILYAIQGSAVYSLNTAATAKQMTYRSKEFQFSRPVSWSAIKIRAASYPTTISPADQRITARLYANGSLVATMYITSEAARRLPITRKEYTWSLELLSYVEIYEVILSDNMLETGT